MMCYNLKMGSKHSQNYTLISQQQIYHFGTIKIYQDNHNHQFFNQSYNFVVQPNVQSQFIDHLLKKNNTCPYLVQIKNIDLQRAKYCSNSAKITVTFEYLPVTLQSLIDRNHIFAQSEIIKLLFQLLSAVKYLNENDSHHGDLYPKFIYMGMKNAKYMYNQSGQHVYKVFDSSYFHPILNGYYRAQKQKTYCAPEVLANLGQKRVYPLYNHHTADTFSIGLIILYCMSGVNPLGAYSSKYQINFHYIQSMFRLAERKGYSENLIALIRQCVKQRNRPNATQALNMFQKINLKQHFQPSVSKYSLKKSKAINSFFTSQFTR